MSHIQTDMLQVTNHIVDQLENKGYTFDPLLLHAGLKALIQTLMNIEVSQLLEADLYERSHKRRAYRNGYRTTFWQTPVGAVEIRVPKLRRGTYYPERLLNDDDLIAQFVSIVKLCVLCGVDGVDLRKILTTLDYITLSMYDIHQIADALKTSLSLTSAPNKPAERQANQYWVSKHHRNSVQQTKLLIELDVIQHHDNEFWQDFARRMIEAGLIVTSNHMLLSHINPYAHIQFDDIQRTVAVGYENRFQPMFKYHQVA